MKLSTPIRQSDINTLKAGDIVYLSGVFYTARDAAHKEMVEALAKGEDLPIDFSGSVVYYTGPTPAKPGVAIGSCGPTSSYRMDEYAIELMSKGLKVMVGKGDRSAAFIKEMIKQKAVYLQAVGGAAALLAQTVKKAKVVSYPDLGPEAIYELEVADFPAIVTYDIYGGNLIENEIKKYQKIKLDIK